MSKTRYASLSWGMIDEAHNEKPTEQYGHTLFDTRTKRITGFTKPDNIYNSYNFDPVVFALSVDPLTASYPMLTPYQFAGNTPIQAIDLDGLEPAIPFFGPIHPKTPLGYIDNLPRDTYVSTYKHFSSAIFKSVFEHYLPKKFISQYTWGKGKSYMLSKTEMSDIHASKVGIHGGTPDDIKKTSDILANIKPGESYKLPDNYSISDAANVGGTLGRFTINLKGTITKDKKDPSKWSFKGEMQFYDKWDFETSPTPAGGLKRTSWGDFQTEAGKKYLKGDGFEVKSDWVPVSQTSSQNYLSWFNGKSEESIQNRVSNSPEAVKEVQGEKH